MTYTRDGGGPIQRDMSSHDTSLSEAVLAAVADAEGTDEVVLSPPLYESINPEALDALFRSSMGEVEFRYLGYIVTVDDGGDVSVARLDNT